MAAASLLLMAGLLPSAGVQAATPVEAGYRDYAFKATNGADNVTAAGNQSKLWYHDGRWWGVMFEASSSTDTNPEFEIWRLDDGSQDWVSTKVTVDDRDRSHADVLWTGNKLYVASSHRDGELRVYRYSYTAAKSWALDAGFPKWIPTTNDDPATIQEDGGTGYATITRAANGFMWVAFTQKDGTGAWKVRVAYSSDSAVTWSQPFDVPGSGNPLDDEDMAEITTIEGGIGVLWSNQSDTDDAFYFAAHVDSDPTTTWQARETAWGGPGTFTADDHMSVHTAPNGDLIAAVKSERNHASKNPGDPLIAVLRRTGTAADGDWSSPHEVTDVATGGTRPILALDASAGQVHVYLTSPDLASQGQQAIYRRSAPLDTLNFGSPSLGTAVIKSASDPAVNDATSTKQNITSTTGGVVIAVDVTTNRYLHACTGVACPTKPVANFTGAPLAIGAGGTVQFTDASTNDPTTWAWTFGDGKSATAKNPAHIYAAPGRFDVKLTATNVGGSASVTKADYITVYFADTVTSSFREDILWALENGITFGCSPVNYCPTANVTREQMASFLVRALDLPPTTTDYFTDDESSTHEANINALRAKGITVGCAPTRYCPTASVRRDEMASFMVRGFELAATTDPTPFTDIAGNTHEGNIRALYKEGITTGCSPTTYCPANPVTRGQMAAFLRRAVEG